MIYYLLMGSIVLFYIFIFMSITCPVGHVNRKSTFLWWYWKIKNLGNVTYSVPMDKEMELVYRLGYTVDIHVFAGTSLIDVRERLLKDHNILVHFSKKPTDHEFTKILVFRSHKEKTMFLLRYL